MTLEQILEECQDILENKSGLYHGWYELGITKYGTPYARAAMNPSANDPIDLARTITSMHYGASPTEAAMKLLEELRDWNYRGRPLNTYDNQSSRLWLGIDPCAYCNGTGKNKD